MAEPGTWERVLRATGIDEVGTEDFRPKLLAGLFTGYATATVLSLLIAFAHETGVLPNADWAFTLVAIKLFTNSLAALAYRTRVLVVPLSALNIAGDVMVMTGTVYFTGGVSSPFVPIYFIEVAVMALLTNVGLTVMVIVGSFLFYVAMVVLVHLGVLPTIAPAIAPAAEITTAGIATMIAFVGIVTLGPGLYVATMVAEIRRSERALAARADELVEASRLKSEFTANITHELRTPLHGILGMGELLEDGIYGPVTPKQLEAIRSIRASASAELALIDSLLVLTRAEALKLEVSTGPVDVAELVASVVTTGRMLVGRRALEVRAAIDGALPPIETDRQKLVQIVVNLLANAVKFTPDDGLVEVAARADGDGVVIEVTDSGRGIPADMLPKIFEPYVQVDGTPVREHGGAGIGLSVVRTLADLLGIEITVESTVGRGSTFTLRVPGQLPA